MIGEAYQHGEAATTCFGEQALPEVLVTPFVAFLNHQTHSLLSRIVMLQFSPALAALSKP